MRHRLLLSIALCLCIATSFAQTFRSGRLCYQVVTNNHEVFVVPDINGTPYSNVGSSDLQTEVTYQNQKYKVIGVGAGAFDRATVAGNLILPEGYIYIDNYAFVGTDAVMVKIPASATEISPTAFAGNKISIISVNVSNPKYAYISTKQGSVTYFMMTNKDKNMLVAAPGAVVDGSSFVKQVTIPESITEIGPYAFYQNPNVTSIILHKGITKYGMYAFGETKITSFSLPTPDAELGMGLCFGCNSLRSVSLPAGLAELPGHMFFSCEALTSITLPEGMKVVHRMAMGSSGLTSVNLPSTLELLDSSALQNTPITRIDLKNVKVIGNQCFSMCDQLTTITGGAQLEQIDNAAFIRCTALKTTQLPASVKRLVSSTFFRCTGIVEATIPAGTEYIGANPFVGCTSLKVMKVDEGNTHFAALDSVLYELNDGVPCRVVSVPDARVNKVLYVREGVKTLGGQSMRMGTTTELYLPEGFTTVESGACMSNEALTKVVLPASTDSLGSQAFNGCNALASVTVLAKNPPLVNGDEVFAGAYENATLYVPKGSVDAYKEATAWKLFQHIEGIDVEDDVVGDVNHDGVVDVSDVNTVINSVLDGYDKDCDVNGDGSVDVSDLNIIINIILGL